MNHYLYLITFNNSMLYVGAHSSVIKPEVDAMYLGSGADLPERTYKDCHKTILNTFDTREELLEAELQYIKDNNCVESSSYYNKRELPTFDRHGKTYPDEANIQRGRTKETHPYLKEAGKKRSLYKGENRTPAQKAYAERVTGVKQGSNPLKGHNGTSNSGFVPWYYITPTGIYNEVYDITKRDFAKTIGLTERQLKNRFHSSNRHKPAKGLPCKGWTFGNINDKPTGIP